MDAKAIETALKDCGVPGRLVGINGATIVLDILDESSEKLERREMGMSDFCDLVLEWRSRLLARDLITGPVLPKLAPVVTAA